MEVPHHANPESKRTEPVLRPPGALQRKVLSMTFMEPISRPRPQARVAQEKLHAQEVARADKAFNIAEELIESTGRERWITFGELVDYMTEPGTGVDVYTAQFVVDNLRSRGDIEYVVGKGLRSKTPLDTFADTAPIQVILTD
jgi:hypothetical protein